MKSAAQSLFRERRIDTARALVLRQEIEAFNADYCAVLDCGNVEAEQQLSRPHWRQQRE